MFKRWEVGGNGRIAWVHFVSFLLCVLIHFPPLAVCTYTSSVAESGMDISKFYPKHLAPLSVSMLNMAGEPDSFSWPRRGSLPKAPQSCVLSYQLILQSPDSSVHRTTSFFRGFWKPICTHQRQRWTCLTINVSLIWNRSLPCSDLPLGTVAPVPCSR